MLKEYRGLRHLQDGLVFPPKPATKRRKAKKFLSDHDLIDAWQRAQARAGLPRLNFHGARHTFATGLRNENQSELQIKDLMGHENVAKTEGYTHAEWDTLKAAVNALKFGGME